MHLVPVLDRYRLSEGAVANGVGELIEAECRATFVGIYETTPTYLVKRLVQNAAVPCSG